MNKDKTYKNYTDFLKDNDFICWQLLPDMKLNDYWENFIKENPHLTEEIYLAEDYLKKKGLNKNLLNNKDKDELLYKIQKSIRNNNPKTHRLIYYIAAACASILLIAGYYYFTENNEKNDGIQQNSSDLIVGSQLNNEDIQFISGKKTISYEKDINVKINETGKVSISQSGKEETIEIEENIPNKLIVPYGKRSKVMLPDGSLVWLNSGSVLEFPTKFSKKSRDINLTGEIFIEVTQDTKKPFYIHTPDFKVNVYGTSFNVSAYKSSMASVVLVKGSVALQTKGKKDEFKLEPNYMACFNAEDGRFNSQKVDVSKYISWKDGYLTFEQTSMSEVLKQIERYYNLSFNFDKDINLQKRTCTGKIHLSDNIDNVMTTITLLTATSYIRDNNIILITNENKL
jgi:hypothetical protein